MARKIISFDNNQMGQLPPPFTLIKKMYGVKINLGRLHGKAFNMDNIKRFFFCLKACKLTTHLIITRIKFCENKSHECHFLYALNHKT